MPAQLNYGNWVRKKILVVLAASTLGAGLLVLLPIGVYRIIPAALFIVLSISLMFPLAAYVAFSRRGGRFQEKVFDLIIQRLGPVEGRILVAASAGRCTA